MNNTNKKYYRGISGILAEKFRKSCLYDLYKSHEDELIIGIRNDYLNIYYNCDSIAKVKLEKDELSCEVNGYYLGEQHVVKKLKSTAIKTEIVDRYDAIKFQSEKKKKEEKKAQQRLYIQNNKNVNSDWVCVDVEWVKQFESRATKKAADFNGRFDIIAVSKNAPHRVALIELKYGKKALGGNSGIKKHLDDFSAFIEKGYYESLKEELHAIIESFNLLGISNPVEKPLIFSPKPEFYFLVLNNSEEPGKPTAKQTMAAYLFEKATPEFKKWKCKRASTMEKPTWNIMDKDSKLPVTCLFSNSTLKTMSITNILNVEDYDDAEIPQ